MATAETLPTWLVVAAEEREFDGIREQLGAGVPLSWPEAQFARDVIANGVRWWLVANGPGGRLVKQALVDRRGVDGVISTGYCGALDPGLSVGDIVVSGEPPATKRVYVRGRVHSAERVVVTAGEKRELHMATGAVAVDMEAAAVEEKATQWNVPFRCIRVVSDTAREDLPLDFNRFQDAAGRFSLTRIAMQALLHPFTVLPALLRLNKNCRSAGKQLGVFFADCRF
jgi:adenosylhomocysteine nucleosidase